jgi:cyclase
MLKQRVIPSLLLQNEGLVKTRKFKSPKYVGDPINAIRIFNEKEVDELIVLDIGLRKDKREPNYRLIEEFASECFMPLCYGGGINSIEVARRVFSLGVEKICVQALCYENIALVKELVNEFGSQSIVASIDVKKDILGRYKLYNSSIKLNGQLTWQNHMARLVSLGVGEVVLNSVDKDGTMEGPDLGLIKKASELVSVPLVAVGGVGSMSDIKSAIEAGASAVAAGAFFVFHGPHRAVLITYPNYNELEKLLSGNDEIK